MDLLFVLLFAYKQHSMCDEVYLTIHRQQFNNSYFY